MSESSQHLIKLLPDKKAFFCKPDQRVLDAALEGGLAIPHSCRGGNCGRCAAKVLTGSYRYDRTTPPPGLSGEHRASGMALLCQIVAEGPLTIEVAKSETAGAVEVVKLPCRIVERQAVAPDVMKLVLQLPRTQPMDFRPGQYLDVLLDRGRRRSYSLAGLPYSLLGKKSDGESDSTRGAGDSEEQTPVAASKLELHVRRVDGGLFSDIAFDPDSTSLLRIEGPLGSFGWRPHAGPSLMIAGGTGYAPMKSMLLEAMTKSDPAPVHLFWGVRNEDDLYERAQLERWQEQHDWFSFTPVISPKYSNESGDHGRVYEQALARYPDLSDVMIYASGPPGLIQSVVEQCAARGVAENRLATDSFDYAVT
ncbi:MAG: 2Fe-2S iron-sulfur cluster-binding protein [Gammaproteobacteria bacterium]